MPKDRDWDPVRDKDRDKERREKYLSNQKKKVQEEAEDNALSNVHTAEDELEEKNAAGAVTQMKLNPSNTNLIKVLGTNTGKSFFFRHLKEL